MGTSQNSLTLYLCAYLDAMFDDIASEYTGPSDWMRDKTRLLHEVRQHGSQVLTITLPAVGKSLDQALDRGLYQPSGSYLGKTRKGEKVPVFLRDLFAQVFDPSSGVLRENPNLAAVVALRQLLMGGKKLLLSCTTRRIYDEVKDFYRTEASNRAPSLDWVSNDPLSTMARMQLDGGRIHFVDLLAERVGSVPEGGQSQPELFDNSEVERPRSSARELRVLQHVCDAIFAAMGDFSDEEALIPKHGPGAVSDLRTGMSKYQFRDWPSKLECFYPFDGYAVHDFMCSEAFGSPEFPRDREVPSKLISVPKTQKSPRLIAAEPSQYQWIQQLLKQQLERRIQNTPLRHAIAFRDQSFNQAGAVAGSKDGSNVTIDLSSASDRLTCWVVERAVRSNETLIDRLHASRTRWVRNTVDERLFDYLVLKKFSTMGSAVIFPLQSIIYGCIGIAATILAEEQDRPVTTAIDEASRRIRVFGDDIIIPRSAFRCMSNLLFDLGLKVNVDKTFTGLNFRESCGIDAFRGVDVTPTYLRQVVTSARGSDVPSLLEVSNNFWKRGYWKTAKWLDSITACWDHLIPVVGPSSSQAGRMSFCGTEVTHLKKRWDPRLQEEQVRTVSFTRKRRRTRGTPRQDLMQWFIESPRPDLPWEAGTDQAEVVTLRPGWRSLDHFRS